MHSSAQRLRIELADRLRAGRVEIEQSVLTRMHTISDPSAVGDPAYVDGLSAAVSAALDYGLAAIELGEQRAPQIPAVLLAQARFAARSGIGLDTVLRRYFAGYSLLGDLIVEEVGDAEDVDLKSLLRTQANLFDRLIAAITAEHNQEVESRLSTSEERRSERVQRLLDGEMLDPVRLNYRLDAWHLAAIVTGPGAGKVLRDLATRLDRGILLVRPEEARIWAWLGGRTKLPAREVHRLASTSWPAEVSLALGEPGHGLEGWRLSHRQARAALTVALRSGSSIVSYGEVALLATALADEVLAHSLHSAYIAPLEAQRDGGAALIETLHAYYGAGCNTSSAAAALGVSRQTVSIRLRTAAERIDRPLGECAAELETALRLWGLDRGRSPTGSAMPS